MEVKSRPSSVRLSGILDFFNEGKGRHKDHQREVSHSKNTKDLPEKKTRLFSFTRRTKSENEVTDKSKSKSHFRQSVENELLPSAPFLICGKEDSVHSIYRDERRLGQIRKEPLAKVFSHTLNKQFPRENERKDKSVKSNDEKQLLSNIPQLQAEENFNQQQQLITSEFSPRESKHNYLETRKTSGVFRLPSEDYETSCDISESRCRQVEREILDGVSKMSPSPSVRDSSETKGAFLKSSDRIFDFAVLCVLHLLWLITRVPCLIFACLKKLFVFVVKLPYVILLSVVKVIIVLAKLLCMVLLNIISVPFKLLVIPIVIVLHILSTFGKVCSMSYQYVKRKAKYPRSFQEGTHELTNFHEHTNEQLDQISHTRRPRSLLQDVNKDLKDINEKSLAESPFFIQRLDIEENVNHRDPLLYGESAYEMLSIHEDEDPKSGLYTSAQCTSKIKEFFIDVFCYVFFLALLVPISVTAVLKPVINFIGSICKTIAPFREDSANAEMFSREDAAVVSFLSEKLDKPASEFHQINKRVEKSCKIYSLYNLKRKLKRISKQSIESEISSNGNSESAVTNNVSLEFEISANGENMAERSPSSTQKMKPETEQHELNKEGCSCDSRHFIRPFTIFLRISFHMLSVFIEVLCSKANVVLHALFYPFASACKVVISFVIRLTPRKILKQLLIKSCQCLPDLRYLSFQLQILKITPSRVSKKVVEIYVKKVSLSLMYLHAQASLKYSPVKKVIRNLTKMWTLIKTLLETVFLSISTVLKMASQALKTNRKENTTNTNMTSQALKTNRKENTANTKRRSLLRLISRDRYDKDISK